MYTITTQKQFDIDIVQLDLYFLNKPKSCSILILSLNFDNEITKHGNDTFSHRQ